jgi:RNA polymerase sigma factor (sigma-70 family)
VTATTDSVEPAGPTGVEPRVRAREQDPGEHTPDPLTALLAGDPGPFEGFVASETPHLLAYFHHLGAAHAEAEDLVQDTLFKLFQSARQYQPDGRFRGYAYRIARNAWIDRARRNARAPRWVDVGQGDQATTGSGSTEVVESAHDKRAAGPDAALERSEESGRFARALAALPEGQRLAFELGVVRELPYTEVADALDVPVGTVKSRVFNAVRRLRELLAEPLTGPLSGPLSGPRNAATPKERR